MLPASDTRSRPGWLRSVSTTSGHHREALSRAARAAALSGPWPSLSAFKTLASVVAPDPCQASQPLTFGSGFQLGQRGDAELPPDPCRRFRSEPRQSQEGRDLARDLRAPLRERFHLAGLYDLHDLRFDRLADVGELLRLAGKRELCHRRGCIPDPACRATVGGHAKRLLAEDLGEVRQQVEAIGKIVVTRKGCDHSSIIGRQGRAELPDACRCLSPHLQRAREPRADGAGAWAADRHHPRQRARDRRQLAGRDWHSGRRACGGARLGRRAPSSRQGAASDRRTSRASGALSPPAPSSCSRSTAISPTTRRTCPGLIEACEGGVDLALGSRWVKGGGTVNWGAVRTFISRSGSFYARTILGVAVRDLTGGFKCFRRAVLEGNRSRCDRRQGVRLPDRDHVPGASGRVHPSSRSRSRSSTAGSASRRWTARSSSRRCSRCRPCAFAHSGGALGVAQKKHLQSPHGRGHRRDVRSRGADERRSRDRRVRGAVVQAVQGDRTGALRDRLLPPPPTYGSSSSTSTSISGRRPATAFCLSPR